MIIYDSKIARLLQGRLNPYDYVTLPLVCLLYTSPSPRD